MLWQFPQPGPLRDPHKPESTKRQAYSARASSYSLDQGGWKQRELLAQTEGDFTTPVGGERIPRSVKATAGQSSGLSKHLLHPLSVGHDPIGTKGHLNHSVPSTEPDVVVYVYNPNIQEEITSKNYPLHFTVPIYG